MEKEKDEFRRILTRKLAAHPPAVSLASLASLQEILANIVAHPSGSSSDDDAKYRRLRLTNDRVRRTIVDVDGAVDYLLAAGFVKTVENFQEFLVMAEDDSEAATARILAGIDVIQDRLQKEQERKAYEERLEKDRKFGNAQYREDVLRHIEEDRQRRRDRTFPSSSTSSSLSSSPSSSISSSSSPTTASTTKDH